MPVTTCKPEAQFESTAWVTGTQVFEPSLLSPKVCISREVKLGVEPGFALRHSNIKPFKVEIYCYCEEYFNFIQYEGVAVS